MPVTEKLIRLRDPNNSSNVFYPFTVGQAVICQDGNGDPKTLQSYIDEIESYQGGGGGGGTSISIPTNHYPSNTLTVTSTSTPFITVGGVTYSIKVDSSGSSVPKHNFLDQDVHRDTVAGLPEEGKIIAANSSGKWSAQSFVEFAATYNAVPLVGHFTSGFSTWFDAAFNASSGGLWFDMPDNLQEAAEQEGGTLDYFTADIGIDTIRAAMAAGRPVYIIADVPSYSSSNIDFKFVFEPLVNYSPANSEAGGMMMFVSQCAYNTIGSVQVVYSSAYNNSSGSSTEYYGLVFVPKLTPYHIQTLDKVNHLPFYNNGSMSFSGNQVSSGDSLLLAHKSNDNGTITYWMDGDTIPFDTTVNNKYLCQNGTWQTVSGGSGTTVTLPQNYSASTGITLSSSALTTVCTIGGTELKLKAPAGGSGGSDGNYYPSAVSWTAGTTAGPTGLITMDGGGTNVSIPAIPAANGTTASGIVTTKAQVFGGAKTFSSTPTFTTNKIATSSGYIQTFPDATGTVVNGTGTNDYLAKWNGTNSITSLVALNSTHNNQFLRKDGTWATPPSGSGSTSLEFNYVTATHTQTSGTGTQGYAVYDVTTDPSKKNFVEVTLSSSHFPQDEIPMIRFNYNTSTSTYNSANLPSEVYLFVHNETGQELSISNELLFASDQTGYWADDPPAHISSNTPIDFWTKLPAGSSNLYSMTVIRDSNDDIAFCMFNWLGSFTEQ